MQLQAGHRLVTKIFGNGMEFLFPPKKFSPRYGQLIYFFIAITKEYPTPGTVSIWAGFTG